MESSLLCDEQFLSSPSLGTTSHPYQMTLSGSTAATACPATDEDLDGYLRACLRKQQGFLPREGYVEKLRQYPELSSFRHRAVRWIIMIRLRLDLAFGTVFSAVNHLDRFVSVYTYMKWEGWMMELLSVACLSIAAKFDELFFPSLHELPVEDLDHSFHPSAIQRMELAVLRALDWHLNCVTPYSYLDPLTSHLPSLHHRHHLRRAVADRAAELLAVSSLDVEFLKFDPSTVALSALRCAALEELAPPETDGYLPLLTHLTRLIPRERKEEMEECHERMEEWVADPVHNVTAAAAAAAAGNPNAGPSPITVITEERHEAVDWIVDVGMFLKMDVYVVDELFCEPKKSRRKRKEMESMRAKGRTVPNE